MACMRSQSCFYIPEYLVIEIMLRLPAKSVARFRCVSTAWLRISTDPSFILSHTRRTPKSYIFNFIPHRKPPMEAFPPPQNELFTIRIGRRKFPHTADVALSSCDGLVFFRGFHRRDACVNYVLNPLTGLRIDLPARSIGRSGYKRSVCEFYHHRWTGEYRLLNVHGSCAHGLPLYAEILSLGGAMNSWRRVHVADPSAWVLWKNPVVVNDRFHWICSKPPHANAILVFDFYEEAFRCMDLPPDVVLCRRNFGLLVIEGGKLGCWMASSDVDLINIWVAGEGSDEEWRATCSLNLADEWRRPIYPSPCHAWIELAFFSRGEILFLFDGGGISFLLCWDLESGNHCTTQLSNHRNMMLDRTLIHRESLMDMPTITHHA